PRSAKPPLRPLAPVAIARASCTRTRRPASASTRAHAHPVTPPPTIATSTRPSWRGDRIGGACSSSQYASATRAMLTRRAIPPVRNHDQPLELQPDELRRDGVRGQAAPPNELVRARRRFADEREEDGRAAGHLRQ